MGYVDQSPINRVKKLILNTIRLTYTIHVSYLFVTVRTRTIHLTIDRVNMFLLYLVLKGGWVPVPKHDLLYIRN